MKVIFLYIEGVMVSGSYLKKSSVYDGYQFNPSCVANLKEIMEKTGAKIVVSSTWRKVGFHRLKQIFQSHGIDDLMGQTPIINYGLRGDEIKQYLEESCLDPTWTVEKFVILDDNDDMGELAPYLIQTNWSTGLDEKAKKRAMNMLLDVCSLFP